MSKNSFGLPGIVLFQSNPQPTSDVGNGSAQGHMGSQATPMSFEQWSQTNLWQYYDELGDGGNDPDGQEYGMWWIECGFTHEQWLGTEEQYVEWVEHNIYNW